MLVPGAPGGDNRAMPPRPLESSPPLSPAERQVLALLAKGHTTKSVAAALNLSVHAVNERLREARRKTGAASSRELARRLAAQENWDKEIGVTGSDLPGAEPELPGAVMTARRRSRNLVIMSATVAAIALAAIGMQIASTPTATRPTAASAPTPATPRGTAKLDPYPARFAAEIRNSDWAAPTELRAWALLILVDGVQSMEVHCAATLCRVDGTALPGAVKRARVGLLGATMRERLRGAGLKVVAADFHGQSGATGPGGFTAFLRQVD